MISGFKSIALGFCAAAIFFGALSFLAPSGNMKKSVRYAFSLVFLVFCIGLFSAFGKLDEIKLEMPQVSVSAASGNAYAEYLCGAVLKDAGITYKKITANTNIKENGDIYINKIRIETEERPDIVERRIREKLEAEKVEVVNE
ncbi:MAG: hypothetical protein KBS52_06805 [Clostridiales bacterium]|nr:hypothetical protein [Candidatus Equinaster intestinalis]